MMSLLLYKRQLGSGSNAVSGKTVHERQLTTQKWEKTLYFRANLSVTIF